MQPFPLNDDAFAKQYDVRLLAVSDRRLSTPNMARVYRVYSIQLSTPNMENYQVSIAYIVYNLFIPLECGKLAWCYRSGFAEGSATTMKSRTLAIEIS